MTAQGKTAPERADPVTAGAEAPPHRAAGVLADRMAAALVHREPGWRLPRRSALARRYGVSTAEIDGAITELARRSLIRRLPDGQLYRASPAEYLIPVEGVAGFGARLDPMGSEVTCQARHVSQRDAPQDVAWALGLPSGTAVRIVRCVWVSGGDPAAISTAYLPEALADSYSGPESFGDLLHPIPAPGGPVDRAGGAADRSEGDAPATPRTASQADGTAQRPAEAHPPDEAEPPGGPGEAQRPGGPGEAQRPGGPGEAQRPDSTAWRPDRAAGRRDGGPAARSGTRLAAAYPAVVDLELSPPQPSVARSLRLVPGQPAITVTVRFDDPAAARPAGLTVVILKPELFRVVVETRERRGPGPQQA